MNRRSFLFGTVGLLAAPAIVRVSSLMPIRPPLMILHGDGVMDDSAAMNHILSGGRAWSATEKRMVRMMVSGCLEIPRGTYRLDVPLSLIGETYHIATKGAKLVALRRPAMKLLNGASLILDSRLELQDPAPFITKVSSLKTN